MAGLLASVPPALSAEPCQRPQELPRTADALAAGYWYAERQDPKCAAEWFRRAVAAQPDRVDALYNLGVALLELREFPESARHLGRALRLRPNEENVRQAWEAAHREALTANVPAAAERARAGDWRGAADAYAAYLRQAPDSAPARYQLAVALAQLGRYEEAERRLREVLEALPENPSVMTALGMTLVRQKRAAEAVPWFQQVEQWRPGSALAALNTAIALADAAQLDAAAEKFKDVIRLEPGNLEAHRQLGRVLLHLRRFDEAREANLRAIALQAGDVTTLRQLGLLESMTGNHAEAVRWYERAVSAGAGDGDTLFKLGKELLEVGRKEEAVANLRRAVERDPSNLQALYVLMRALSKQHPEQARQIESRMRAVRESEMSTARARLLSNSALQAAQRQEWEHALGQLREALEVCGECADRATLRRNLGLILAQSGDRTGAMRELEHALRLDPNDHDAALALDILRRSQPAAP